MRLPDKFLRFIVAMLVGSFSSSALATISPGESLPDLNTFTLEGNLPDTHGKVVLIDVWASWCAPCKASFPELNSLQRNLGDAGLCIIGISADKTAKAYERFVAQLAPDFATARDADQRLIAQLSPPSMPTTFLFGRDGRLRSIHRGFHGKRTVTALRSEIATLLEESK